MAQTGLTRRLATELIDKMNNPDNHQNFGEMDEDDLEVITDSKSYIEMCVVRRLSKKIRSNQKYKHTTFIYTLKILNL